MRPAQFRRRFPVRKSLGWTDPRWLDGYVRVVGAMLVLIGAYTIWSELVERS